MSNLSALSQPNKSNEQTKLSDLTWPRLDIQIPLSFDKWRDLFKKAFPALDKYRESRTASVVARHLESLGYHVQRKIGGHGVVGILTNREGKTVSLRSELDALPMEEDTGLTYASKVRQVDADGYTKPVMHACGHDMHIASLLGAADLLHKVKNAWFGTLIYPLQPCKERLLGAQAMIDDALFDKIPLPDFVLGQHAVPTRAGSIGTQPGQVLGFLDSLAVRIDPILMARCIVSRLQMIVAREIDFKEPCAVTCSYLHGGTDASIIPEFADFTLDIPKRIIDGECRAANSPKSPRIVTSASCPPIDNDEEATTRFTRALRSFYGDDAPKKIIEMNLDITADDFVLLGHPPGQKPIPYVYWNYGVTPRDEYDQAEKEGTLRDLPFDHNPRFVLEIEPSLRAGIEGLAIVSVEFFGL
ncbi:peptidase M20D/carboxypeptidase Ss1 [Lophiotrema nucula]|uniref:Peptidase M20D/carboxypeptidase Ss1 n=1 Tax=Lophiotrema nucula TaxID=690887 RepID=A0A6A5ZGV3_9PLEO|nr:peptidase M20D/carboxypeptidase Ss1 [Lophiotrema nucula]